MKVSPKSSRNELTGWLGDTLKLAVTAAPEKGKANDAVIELLARELGLPRSSIGVVRGHGDSRKLLEVRGLAPGEVLRRLKKPTA